VSSWCWLAVVAEFHVDLEVPFARRDGVTEFGHDACGADPHGNASLHPAGDLKRVNFCFTSTRPTEVDTTRAL
jgi:hypothetical protein